MARRLNEQDKAAILQAKSKTDSTLDNGATHTQMRYLARVYTATGLERFKDGFLRGLDYLLAAQYRNGGWPQFYPSQGNPKYSRYITFNDGAMIGAARLLRDVAEQKPEYAFVDQARRGKTQQSVNKGIECILKTQIVVDGRRTAWCQQHDDKTLKPRDARTYEKASITGSDSADIVRFLMDIRNPNSRVIDAVQSAVAWFDAVKLGGIKVVRKPDGSEKGYDVVVVEDPNAPPIWARFYDIRTNRPIFCGRDGRVKYSLAEIEHERRTGYSWYGSWPRELLTRDYGTWQKKWVSDINVLHD
jgi:PelA/Pel-15E family pectate lyase